LSITRFSVAEPHAYRFMKDHRALTDGTLLVLEVAPECAQPRQAAMPVLYAGDVAAEIAHEDATTGRLVVIVPGHVDLTATPLFYGAPELPERVDVDLAASELARAVKDGIEPFPAAAVEAALKKGGSDLSLAGSAELYESAAVLLQN
jgi:hypothetical protein